MIQERPIEDWLGELPEPERTEALEARRMAVERDSEYFPKDETATSHADALWNGFDFEKDGGSLFKWKVIHRRALSGEFDRPSEVDRLRARIAELEGALSMTLQYVKHASTTYLGKEYDQELVEQREANEYMRQGNARSILNKK